MLSYIELINRFWEVEAMRKADPTIKKPFSGNETKLYFHLLKVANHGRWPVRFAYSDKELTGNCGISQNTLRGARIVLESAGFFGWEQGGKGQGDSAVYEIRYQKLTPKSIEECESRYQKPIPNATPNDGLDSEKVSDKGSKIDTYTYIETEDSFENSTSGDRAQKLTPTLTTGEPLADTPPTAPRCAAPPPAPVRPAAAVPARLDPYDPRSADQVNVRFTDWYTLYGLDVQERRCRMLWVELTDEERLKAMEHTPRYVEATTSDNKRWRKNPEKYLSEKTFNDEIRNWHAKDTRTQPDGESGSGAANPARAVISTEYGPPPRRRTGSTR